jgi:hypothetical protein
MSKKRSGARGSARPPDTGEAAAADARRVSSFVVEVVVDEQADVRRMSVLHVEDNEQESWRGWEPERVVDFMARRAHLSEGPVSPGKTAPPTAELAAPRLGDLEGKAYLTADVPSGLCEGMAFDVRVTLDPGPPPREGDLIDYVAVVLAKSLGQPVRHQVGESRGQLASTGSIRLSVPVVAPRRGLYRLEAGVLLSGGSSRRSVAAHGCLIQVC